MSISISLLSNDEYEYTNNALFRFALRRSRSWWCEWETNSNNLPTAPQWYIYIYISIWISNCVLCCVTCVGVVSCLRLCMDLCSRCRSHTHTQMIEDEPFRYVTLSTNNNNSEWMDGRRLLSLFTISFAQQHTKQDKSNQFANLIENPLCYAWNYQNTITTMN